MGTPTPSATKTIREAVADGSLIDVTETAKKAGILYPTFMTPFMVAKYKAQSPHGLLANLCFFAGLIANATGYDLYGPVNYGDHECILEPNEEFGHVVLILELGKADELNLERTSGDNHQYLM